MKALAPELLASAAEVDGGVFSALFPAGSAHGANATQGGNFHGVFEASPLGPKGGQKPRAHRIPSLREIPKQETIRVSVEELGLPSIRGNFGPNDEPSISQLALPGVRVRLPSGSSVQRFAPNASRG